MDGRRKADWCWELTQVDLHTQYAVFTLHDGLLPMTGNYPNRKGKEGKEWQTTVLLPIGVKSAAAQT